MGRPSRRQFLASLAAPAFLPLARRLSSLESPRDGATAPCRVRTITAGVTLRDADDLRPVESALVALSRARQRFVAEGYEVQTVRIATNPVVAGLSAAARERALGAVQALDRLVAEHDAIVSIGPVLLADELDEELAPWAAEVARTCPRMSFSAAVATPSGGVQAQSAVAAARVMKAIAERTPGGLGNFGFAAAANVPAGTPFFPVAWHHGPPSLALGLESAGLVQRELEQVSGTASATAALRQRLTPALVPIEHIGAALALQERRRYLGIDTSPAPGLDRSIGGAIESLTERPFGESSTLEACAAITAALKSLKVRTCGYAGLMLPVLEDPVLAQRANEGRYGVRDLLLYSSVCGTGLDVVPVPGDTEAETLARVIRDVAALSARWQKPLSARLLLVPGKGVGEQATFEDPRLTACNVFAVA